MTRKQYDDNLPLSHGLPVDEDVRREVESHLLERAAELEARGMTRERALAVARESFGDRAAVEAECREIERRRRATVRRSDILGALWNDLVVGFRVLRKSPGFTVAAILTLALGIGANTTIFSIVDGVILRPLPYDNADRLVTIVERHENSGWGRVPWSNFVDLQAQSHSFDAMASYGAGPTTVLGGSTPVRVTAGYFSAGFFNVLATHPMLGRLPSASDHLKGAPSVAVVSHAFWRDHLGSPSSLEGVRIKLGEDNAVIGVLPPDFDFPSGNQVWRPLETPDQSMSRTSHNWNVIARLRPAVTLSAAGKDLDDILARLKPQYYPDFDAVGSRVTPLQEAMTASVRKPLFLLLAASAVLLLGACTNLASVMLARGTRRAGEFAVRSALGATRNRLVRQLLTESALLALLGGAAGVLLAALLLRALASFAPDSLALQRVHMDLGVQLFAFGVAAITAALFGLLPAIRLARPGAGQVLREGTRGTTGGERMRTWNLLVGAEVALTVVLLSGSALLIRSFARVLQTQLGFDPAAVTTARVDLPAVNYDGVSPAVSTFHERALENLRRTPGLDAVGFTNVLPLESGPDGSMEVEGKPHNARGPFTGYSSYRIVGGDFFAAMRIPIERGRAFGSGDDAGAPRVVVVNHSFAEKEWPGQDPVGRRLRPAGMDSGTEPNTEPWFTVVGVVGDARAETVTAPYEETYYFDHRQRPPWRAYSVAYVARSTVDAGSVQATLRRAITAVDPQVPVATRAMSTIVSRSVTDRRFTMLVLGAFALVALLLAVVGIYGMVAYSVAQRTREIGVRLALGATPGGVRRMVLATSMRSIVPGLIAGGLLAVAATRVLRTLLYDTSPLDAPSMAAAIGILGIAALTSSLIPAIRATRVDPIIAMRAE